jgi:hypothetical protein
MYCEVPSDLRQRMEQAGITIKAVCQRVKKPYSTIGGQLNGFSPLDERVREVIEQMIQEKLELQHGCQCQNLMVKRKN